MEVDETPRLGRLIEDDDRRRDAVHMAVVPVTADSTLRPGQHVGLCEEGNTELVGPVERTLGVVDPFLKEEVQPGQRFWLFLYPGTVTGLRHIWTHPEFERLSAADKAKVAERERFFSALAENEDDVETRLVYADWLDERGEHKEAERQRSWPAAKEWLVRLCHQAHPLSGSVTPEELGEGEDFFDHEMSYDDLIGEARLAYYRAVEEDGEYWVGCGADESLRDLLEKNSREFWSQWSIVTGLPVPEGIEEKAVYTCGC